MAIITRAKLLKAKYTFKLKIANAYHNELHHDQMSFDHYSV